MAAGRLSPRPQKTAGSRPAWLLERAVAAGDAASFYAAARPADPSWSVAESTLHDQRIMRIITAKYPEADAKEELSLFATTW